ncbi:hypothetical protein ACFL00_04690 [Pseudomonadota bacterium]
MLTIISRFSILSTLLLSLAFFAISPVTAFAQSSQAQMSQQFGKGHPRFSRDLPPGRLKNRLESLPPQAAAAAMKALQEIEFTGGDLETLRLDDRGGVYFEDTLLPDAALVEQAAAATTPALAVPSTTLADAFKLHSRPGASKTVFIDFDGHVFSNTAWGNGTYSAQPYDLDGNGATFNDTERSRIAEIWHRVAEDLSPFNIDVTTEEPASFDRYTGRILVTRDVDKNGRNMPGAGAGGVAYVDKFGVPDYHTYWSPALVFYNNLAGGLESFVAEAASHEFGHNLGLSHDGSSGANATSYYGGHGSGLVSWAPIMGNSYYNNVTEWSKGEYPDANQTQDDLAIIQSKLGLRPDDHGDAIGSGTALVVGSDGSVVSSNPELDPENILPENKGIINSRADVDVFTFSTGAGTLSLTVQPAWDAFYEGNYRRGANLDIRLELRNSSGGLVTSNNPSADTSATISANIAAGTYHLFVSGEGTGSLSTGYSDYASIGEYFINGTVPPGGDGGGADTTPPNPNPMTWASAPAAMGETAISMTATVATDETSSVEYNFRCIAGGSGCSNSGWISSNNYTANGLVADTSYTFNVIARDQANNVTTASPSSSARTNAPPPPTANITLVLSTNSRHSKVNIIWSGATGTKVEIYRNGSNFKRTANDGAWADKNVAKGNTYFYRLCERGSKTVCSAELPITL